MYFLRLNLYFLLILALGTKFSNRVPGFLSGSNNVTLMFDDGVQAGLVLSYILSELFHT